MLRMHPLGKVPAQRVHKSLQRRLCLQAVSLLEHIGIVVHSAKFVTFTHLLALVLLYTGGNGYLSASTRAMP